MNRLRLVGRDTGQLTDEQLRYLQAEIEEAARPKLWAREIFPIKMLPNAGIREYKWYQTTDMGPALVSMEGDILSLDRTEKASHAVKILALNKDFVINWRDLEASRASGTPLDSSEAQNAARQVAEEENWVLLTGETAAHPLYGVQGLSQITGKNTTAGGAWPANAFANINSAIGELETDGHTPGPYVLIAPVAQIRKLHQQVANTGLTYLAFLKSNGIIAEAYADDMLRAADDGLDSAVVCKPGVENFHIGMGQDITIWPRQIDNMNTLVRVYEALGPIIKQPTSICEITGIT